MTPFIYILKRTVWAPDDFYSQESNASVSKLIY